MERLSVGSFFFVILRYPWYGKSGLKQKYRYLHEISIIGCTELCPKDNVRSNRGDNFVKMTTFAF